MWYNVRMNKKGKENSNYRHGHNSKTLISPTYISWSAMKNRCKCNHPSQIRYKKIKVCKQWELFENFLKDMGERPSGMTLDRINPLGNYEPENCRWDTRSQQQQNTIRASKIVFNGATKHIEEWATLIGVSSQVLRRRIQRGWTIERTLQQKKRKYGI